MSDFTENSGRGGRCSVVTPLSSTNHKLTAIINSPRCSVLCNQHTEAECAKVLEKQIVVLDTKYWNGDPTKYVYQCGNWVHIIEFRIELSEFSFVFDSCARKQHLKMEEC